MPDTHHPDSSVVDLDQARRDRADRALPEPAFADGATDEEILAGLEATLDEPELVDAEPATAAPVTRREVKPILPTWAKDRVTLLATIRWSIGYAAHVAAFHAFQSPKYGARILAQIPVGLVRSIHATAAWIFDFENREQRRNLIAGADERTFLALKNDHRGQVKGRMVTAALIALLAAVAAVVVYLAGPAFQIVGVTSVLVVLAYVGRSRTRPLLGRAIDTAKTPPLTSELIVTALGALGIGELNKALAKDGPAAIGFPAPITRDGPGWRADIDLPTGVTAAQIIDRREELASGLRRPLGCLWPEVDADVHAGRLILFVADKALSTSDPVEWDLAKAGKVNVFEPIPIGRDPRGRTVSITLMFVSGIIGSLPRMGKTFYLRLLALAASLDPRVELHLYGLKGAEFDVLKPVGHAIRSGDDPEDIEAMAADLAGLQREMRRRYKVMKNLPPEVCPESKVTDELASRRDLDLHPIFLAIDETQLGFENKAHGPQLREVVEDLVRRGPAAGIMVWLATQRPDDRSIPTAISSNATLRICLRVMTHQANDMVLGSSMYKSGWRATMFSTKDLGVAYLAGETDDPIIMRGAKVDSVDAKPIVARARAARVAQNRLTGMAAGEIEADDDSSTLLDHLLAVWPETEPQLHGETLADRLGNFKPELYKEWTAEQVHAAARPHGVASKQVKVAGVNRRGLVRRDVTDALGHTDEETTR
ncbi:cell division protein FtsK [Nocardioides sp. NPDC057772]|uniref:cell division protein FtsK n=1 Tax=Nocardioides sp. NPDC057772 TaxID=3346245 RepID=UPI00366D902F